MTACFCCKFWSRDEDSMFRHLGTCRKNAPVFRSENQNSREGHWPQTMEDEWCGEFKKSQSGGRA